jgi:hypothetical protein
LIVRAHPLLIATNQPFFHFILSPNLATNELPLFARTA